MQPSVTSGFSNFFCNFSPVPKTLQSGTITVFSVATRSKNGSTLSIE